MKKIRILYWCVLSLFVLLLLLSVGDLFVAVFYKKTFETVYQATLLGSYSKLVHVLFLFLIVIGLFKAQKALRLILKRGSFNNKSGLLIRQAGQFIMAYGIGYLFFQINFLDMNGIEQVVISIVTDLLIVLVGFTIYSFSEILKDGELIKQEQDLTI